MATLERVYHFPQAIALIAWLECRQHETHYCTFCRSEQEHGRRDSEIVICLNCALMSRIVED